jgi:hypothetical protein
LLESRASLQTFLRRIDVAPINDEAERTLRSIVLERKVFGLDRSRRGDDFIARGYPVVESCDRQRAVTRSATPSKPSPRRCMAPGRRACCRGSCPAAGLRPKDG